MRGIRQMPLLKQRIRQECTTIYLKRSNGRGQKKAEPAGSAFEFVC